MFANQQLICPTPTVDRFQLEIRRFRKFPNCCIELCIPYQYKYKVATKKSSLFNQLKLEGYSERAMKIVLVAWVTHKAGMQCSIRSSSISTVP